MYKQDLQSNNQQCLIWYKSRPNQIIFLIYTYKEDLALNNLKWLICDKKKIKNPYNFIAVHYWLWDFIYF